MRRGNNGDRAVVCLIFCAFESVRFIMTSQDTSVSITSIQSENWSGCIPIILSLAPTSLSSPSMPSSIHVLVHRHSFLHIGLKQAVMRLYKFAPVSSFSSLIKREEPGDENTTCTGNHQVMNDSKQDAQQEQYPVCWFEDEDTQFALRWHLFVGVLWDMKQQKKKLLPWKIRLHFTQYPSSQILPMDNGGVLETVERYYMNSLKQALFSQYSSNKVAMNMSKQTHEQIWDSITTNNYQLFHQVNTDLQQTSSSDIKLLPVRVLVNSTKPSIQRPCRISDDESLALGSLLVEWCPTLFIENENGQVQPINADTSWTLQGIKVELSSNLVDLWKSLCCPDHFLYIIISTST